VTRARGESGFTLIELAIAATISFLVFAATLTVLTSLVRQRDRVEKQAEVETQARLTIDRLARQLRNLASPADTITATTSTQPKAVDRNLPDDLVFKDIGEALPGGSQNVSNVRRVRYCLQTSGTVPGRGYTATPGRGVLWMQIQTWTTALPPAMPATTDCPGTGWPEQRIVAENVVNASQTPVRVTFRYSGDAGLVTDDSAAARETISRLEASVVVDHDTAQSPEATTLTSSVFLRNQNRTPGAAFTLTQLSFTSSCNVQLNGSASQDPESKPLEYRWYLNPTSAIPSDTAPTWAEGVVVQRTVPFGTHTYLLKVSDPAGLVDTHTETRTCPTS
jgi:type II secretory pathway pseudopilin PulG